MTDHEIIYLILGFIVGVVVCYLAAGWRRRV